MGYKVISSLYASTYATIKANGEGGDKNNTILMGSFVQLLDEENDIWQKVKAFSIEGWIKKSNLGDTCGLKCFFVDVGQGDGALLEIGNDEEGIKILIDGGPSDNMSRYLNKWQYAYQLKNNKPIHIDYVFVSHFDKDHYEGLIDIINDPHYTFGTIFHNGIGKFNLNKKGVPTAYNDVLGKRIKEGNKSYLVTHFDTLQDINNLQQKI